MDFYERITIHEQNFTNSDTKLCRFVLKNPQAIEDATISYVAELAGVSVSAVLRFCKRLGYAGYSEFRYDLIKNTHSSQESANTSLMQNYLNAYSYGIDELFKLPQDMITEFANIIITAPYIKVLGSVSSSLPAMQFYYSFTALGKRVIPLTGALSPWADSSLSHEDLIIIFSATGGIANEGISDFLMRATELGCTIILITCNRKSKIARHATHILEIPSLLLPNHLNAEPQPLMMILVSVLAGYAKQML